MNEGLERAGKARERFERMSEQTSEWLDKTSESQWHSGLENSDTDCPFFSRIHATLYAAKSVHWSVGK